VRPEDERIHQLIDADYDSRRGTDISWPVLYHLSHLRANLTEWLPIQAEETVLEFGADSGQLTGGFLKKAAQVTCLEESVSRSRMLAKRHRDAENLTVQAGDIWKHLDGTYDWIIATGVLSEARRYFAGNEPEVQAVQKLRKHLKPGGHLILAADNRFGLKYWAGAMEPHTGRYFDSLEGNGTTFSKKELEAILEKSGCSDAVFYYPYPERWFPMSIYSDAWLPKTGELNTNLRNFEGERLVLFDEEKVYDQLIRDGRFPEFTNTYLCIVGPIPEEQSVYVKYSNDRSEAFMIRTDIVKNATGQEVRKVPVSKAAVAHVQQLKHWEEVLSVSYEKQGIRANRCMMRGNTACFEFLKGRTFEAKLDELRKQKDYAGLSAELQQYKKILTAVLENEWISFAKSETFVEMFGNPEFTKAYLGAPINNLDWIFGNLMETEEGLQIIDYEWTFPVQVPMEYLIWRAVSLYLHSRTDLQGLGLMASLGITPEEEQIFTKMEHHFQLWLLNGTVTIGEQYLACAGRTISLDEMVAQAKKNRMQIYVDTGNGFSEGESFWIDTEPDKQGVIHLELILPAGTKALRLDPAEETCLVKVRRLVGELGGSYALSFIHNGRELEEQGILYTTTDPWIQITNLVEGTGRIYGELTVEKLHPDTAYACMNLLNRVRSAERLYQSWPFRFLKKLKRTFGK
jgi:SAM-dependent methyltransferase